MKNHLLYAHFQNSYLLVVVDEFVERAETFAFPNSRNVNATINFLS